LIDAVVGAEGYWLEVCNGREAALAYMQASGDAVIAALERYPILMLPEFPATIAAMGASTGDAQVAAACAENAQALRSAQETLRDGLTGAYAALMSNLALSLAGEQAGDRRSNLERAVEAFRAAGDAYGGGPERGTMLVDGGTSCWQLAELGVDPQENIERAATLYAEARAEFGAGENAGQCAVNEAQARMSLAEHGVEPLANFEAAGELYIEAHGHFDPADSRATSCVVGAAHARTRLSEVGELEAGP
jgi:hypothetical protein